MSLVAENSMLDIYKSLRTVRIRNAEATVALEPPRMKISGKELVRSIFCVVSTAPSAWFFP